MLDSYLAAPDEDCAKVGIDQLHKADMCFFKHLMRMTKKGLTPDDQGVLPLDKAVQEAMKETDVRLYLAQRKADSRTQRKDRSRSPKPWKEKREEGEGDKGEGKGKARRQRGGGKKQGESKGKGKGEGKARGGRMPEGLHGGVPYCGSKPVCFAFQFGTCAAKCKTGESCPKGLHVCCKPGCFGHHGYVAVHGRNGGS